jgi:hypothetical protein
MAAAVDGNSITTGTNQTSFDAGSSLINKIDPSKMQRFLYAINNKKNALR